MRCKAFTPEHTHETVEQTRQCWHRKYFGTPVPTVPVASSPPPPAPRDPSKPRWWYDPVTTKQLTKVGELNGDRGRASRMNKGQCSEYIKHLIENPIAPTPAQEPKRMTDPRLDMVRGMIDMLSDGYYATAPEGENRHVDFVRVSRPKKGQFANSIKIQTKHSDLWKEALVFWPSGRHSLYNSRTVDMLMEIIADYKTCALRYSVEAKACSHCNKDLTDDRSRHYLVGPICEKVHGYTWPVSFADEFNGATFEQLRASGREFKAHHKQFVLARAS